MEIRKSFIERVIKHWNRLPQKEVESTALAAVKNMQRWHSCTWFSGGLSSIRLMVELNYFKGLFLLI